jgi:23S rRNA pseudouridine1911/1915/1917 synthase
VVGDDVYGGGGGRRLLRLLARRHFLHAAWLRFRHPTTNSLIDLRSRLPIDLREVVSVVAEQVVPDPLMAYAFFNHPLVPLSSVEN